MGQFVWERYGISISRSGCLKWLHRLGFAYKRPKKRLLKADEGKRTDFGAEYATLWEECQEAGARIFFADEAHFRADAELRGKWTLKGEPALVESTSPKYGEKAQLLLGGMSGDGRGGVAGTGGKQQRCDLGGLPEATEGETPRAPEGDLGQRSSPSRGGVAGIPTDARPGVAVGESAGLQSGLQR